MTPEEIQGLVNALMDKSNSAPGDTFVAKGDDIANGEFGGMFPFSPDSLYELYGSRMRDMPYRYWNQNQVFDPEIKLPISQYDLYDRPNTYLDIPAPYGKIGRMQNDAAFRILKK